MSSISKFSVLLLEENRKIIKGIFAFYCAVLLFNTLLSAKILPEQVNITILLCVVFCNIILCFIFIPCARKFESALNITRSDTIRFLSLFICVSTMSIAILAAIFDGKPIHRFLGYLFPSTIESLVLMPSFLVTLVFAHDPVVAKSLIKGIPGTMLRILIAAIIWAPRSRVFVATSIVLALVGIGIIFGGGEGGSNLTSAQESAREARGNRALKWAPSSECKKAKALLKKCWSQNRPSAGSPKWANKKIFDNCQRVASSYSGCPMDFTGL